MRSTKGILLTVLCSGISSPVYSREFSIPSHHAPSLAKFKNEFQRNLSVFGDLLRVRNPEIDRALEAPELTAVTAEFGSSVIDLSQLPRRSEVVRSSVVPWSSWYFPIKDKELFSDPAGVSATPLGKYDIFRKAKYRGQVLPSAVTLEAEAHNDSSASWEGYCDSWSIASLLMPEPTTAKVFKYTGGSVTFKVSDQKALILKMYENMTPGTIRSYGQKFTGQEDSWIQPDLFPDQVHRFVEVMMFEQKKPFLMDHDPGPEIWTVPVYKANYNLSVVEGNPNAVNVVLYLYYAGSLTREEKSNVGTKEVMREYRYTLFGKRNSLNQLEVESGVWTKSTSGVDSRRDHPDYFLSIPDPSAVKKASKNEAITEKSVDLILGLPGV